MKVLLVCSATGGVGKSTACLRLAEQLDALRIPAAVVDLSPYPSAQVPTSVSIVQGSAASTRVGAQALLKPFAERCQVVLLDAPPLGDTALESWLPHCTHLAILTRVDVFALNSVGGIWKSLDELRSRYPSVDFLGFLPMLVRDGDRRGVALLHNAAKGFVLPAPIAFDEGESLAAQRAHFAGLETISIPQSRALPAYRDNAQHLIARLGLVPQAPPAEEKPTGLLTRAWRAAASLLRSAKSSAEVTT